MTQFLNSYTQHKNKQFPLNINKRRHSHGVPCSDPQQQELPRETIGVVGQYQTMQNQEGCIPVGQMLGATGVGLVHEGSIADTGYSTKLTKEEGSSQMDATFQDSFIYETPLVSAAGRNRATASPSALQQTVEYVLRQNSNHGRQPRLSTMAPTFNPNSPSMNTERMNLRFAPDNNDHSRQTQRIKMNRKVDAHLENLVAKATPGIYTKKQSTISSQNGRFSNPNKTVRLNGAFGAPRESNYGTMTNASNIYQEQLEDAINLADEDITLKQNEAKSLNHTIGAFYRPEDGSRISSPQNPPSTFSDLHHLNVSQIKQNTLRDIDSTCPSIHKSFFKARRSRSPFKKKAKRTANYLAGSLDSNDPEQHLTLETMNTEVETKTKTHVPFEELSYWQPNMANSLSRERPPSGSNSILDQVLPEKTHIVELLAEKRKVTADRITALQSEFDNKCLNIRADMMSKIFQKAPHTQTRGSTCGSNQKRGIYYKTNKDSIKQITSTLQKNFDMVGDLEQFQETMAKNRSLSKEAQRKRLIKERRPDCLNFDVPKPDAPKAERAQIYADKKDLKPLDHTKYRQEQHTTITKLQVETRIKQLNDYSASKGCKWRSKHGSGNEDYDFFKFLDEQLKLQKKLHPAKKCASKHTSPKSNPGGKSSCPRAASPPGTFSAALTKQLSLLDRPAKTLGSKMMKKRRTMDKNYQERKNREYKEIEFEDIENIEYLVRKKRADAYRKANKIGEYAVRK